jgi:hypothetical protein
MDHFNLDNYLMASDDLFEQLEADQFASKCRRFSYSIDDRVEVKDNTIDDELELLYSGITAPPSSPADSTVGATVVPLDTFQIPHLQNDNDGGIYYDADNEFLKEEQEPRNVPLLISSYNDMKLYKIPKNISSDAHKIWNAATIPEIDTIYNIERQLFEWASNNASLEIHDNKIVSIKWKSASGYSFKSSWVAFLKWIICASVYG